MSDFINLSYSISVDGVPWLSNPAYDYLPTKTASAVFVAVFAISTLLHVLTAWRYRMWWLLPTVGLTCVLELVGWSTRLWASMHTFTAQSLTAFWIQWVTLAIGPNFMMATMFVTFSQLTKGASLSCFRRMKPRRNSAVFLSLWSTAVLAQIPGVIMMAVLLTGNPDDTVSRTLTFGATVMLVVILFFFVCLITEFAIRLLLNRPVRSKPKTMVNVKIDESRSKCMVLALVFCTWALLPRYVWRLVETMSDFSDFTNTAEVFIWALDGAEVAAALLCLNVFHPAFLRTFREREMGRQLPRSADQLLAHAELNEGPLSFEEEGPPDYETVDPRAAEDGNKDGKLDVGMAV